MAIPISKYVKILSLAGGAPEVFFKSTMGRWFTTNALAPMGKVLEFTSAKNVGLYFGQSSDEYAYANKYFKFISKKNKQPKLISFARYTTSAVGASILSGFNTFSLTSIQAEASDLSLTVSYVDPSLGLQSGSVAGDNLTTLASEITAASSLADVATALQKAIRTIEVGEATPFSDATVSYENVEGNGYRFVLTLPAGYGSFQACEGTLASVLGWSIAYAILSDGNNGTNSIAQEVERVMDASDNCYTFAFIEELDLTDIEAVAEWNTNANSQYIYMILVKTQSIAATYANALQDYDCALVYDNLGELQVYQPMAVGACVDFQKSDASVNFMYQQFTGDTPTVSTEEVSDALDALKVNYYGATQTAGKLIAFFQRGKCLGQFADMTIAFNAIWLKNSVIVNTLNLFLLNDSIPANADGKGKIEANLNDVWAQGISNGVILRNKTITPSEKAFIEAQTGDDMAWQAIQQNGFWFNSTIETDAQTGEKFFSFLLIYGAADQIRKVEGTHIALTTAQ